MRTNEQLPPAATTFHALAKPLLNTLLFTIVVPGTVAGWLPCRLHGDTPATSNPTLRTISILLIAIGVAIYLHTAFWGFALRGRGTPSPIAPTKKLVVEGLHRYVRNPMYIGVGLIVLGQALLFRSWHLLEYLAFFALAVYWFVLFYEEPTLHKQFGEEYDDYRRRVPRWIPRF
jgi:protein-S-isoprenylcysteine O-methyltransferase Ste14